MRDGSSVWRVFLSASSGGLILGSILLVTYVFLPTFLVCVFDADAAYIALAKVGLTSVIFFAFGLATPLFDLLFSGCRRQIVVNVVSFNTVLWVAFVFFAFLAWFTAPQVPILAALSGADPDTLAILREQFLKAREGWQAPFVYVNALLTGALIPYSLALMFCHQMRWRWLAITFFLVFSLSFLEKAYFLKVMLPVMYLVAQGQIKTLVSPRVIVCISVFLLLVVSYFSGAGSSESLSEAPFFSSSYAPHGVIQHLLWRSFSIPLVTAADAFRVIQEQFAGEPLGGATSSFVAFLTGLDRIEFERLVFMSQWGQNVTGTGSANSVYFTEAFANFGWLGVVVFSFVIGLLMRLFAVSRNEAFRALWPIFAFGLYTSGLLGLLLSNGFCIVFALAVFVRMKVRGSQRSHVAAHQSL